ncbi:MAG: AAA family ATPase [Actinomycetales bacterium]|nr:AAA family ATPase [Actinomycetales bacterium]
MLTDLVVRGLGTVSDAHVRFAPGLNVITGETGAGKTMLLRALTLVLGGKAEPNWVARGQSEAVADAMLALEPKFLSVLAAGVDALSDIDTETGESVITLGRVLGTRSRASVNGRMVPAAIQAALGERLIAVHGQHEQRLLARAATQRDLLDRFAGPDHCALVARADELFDAVRRAEAEVGALHDQLRAAGALALAARDACEAFDSLNPADDEMESLSQRIALLSDAENVVGALAGSLSLIAGDDHDPGAQGRIHAAARDLGRLADSHPALASVAQRLTSIGFDVDDIAAEVTAVAGSLQSDPAVLQEAQHRRSAIGALLRLHGKADVQELRVHVEHLRRSADSHQIERALAEGVRLLDERRAAWAGCLVEVSAGRATAAHTLQAEVTGNLSRLGLAGARFIVHLQAVDPSRYGAETVEFQLDTAGVAVPLADGVSGGEMSRVALAIECALAGANPVPVMAFDEVDAGIGGATAHDVAAALAAVSRTAQVIVVTHLPQVAALAQHHIRVSRDGDGTKFTALDESARIDEIARMLGHGQGMDAARELAVQMLARGRRIA